MLRLHDTMSRCQPHNVYLLRGVLSFDVYHARLMKSRGALQTSTAENRSHPLGARSLLVNVVCRFSFCFSLSPLFLCFFFAAAFLLFHRYPSRPFVRLLFFSFLFCFSWRGFIGSLLWKDTRFARILRSIDSGAVFVVHFWGLGVSSKLRN